MTVEERSDEVLSEPGAGEAVPIAARSGDGAPIAARAGDGSAPGEAETRTFRLLRLVSVEVELPEQYPVVVLEDAEEHGHRIGFRIGTAEGVALAHAWRGTRAPRPLTAELFADTLERFAIEVLAVRLTGRVGSTYLAELDLLAPSGRQVLSCRPSDGLCLALGRRVPAPVLADERLLLQAGDVEPPAAGDEDARGPATG